MAPDAQTPVGPFREKFSRISRIFDELESELDSMTETDAWSPEKVMVAEMMRLRMRRLVRRSEQVYGNVAGPDGDEQTQKSVKANQRIDELMLQVGSLEEKLKLAEQKLASHAYMDDKYQTLCLRRTNEVLRLVSKRGTSELPDVRNGPPAKSISRSSSSSMLKPPTTDSDEDTHIKGRLLTGDVCESDIERRDDFLIALTSNTVLSDVIDMVEAEIRDRVKRVCTGECTVRLYIHDASAHALWYGGMDGRIIVPLDSAPGKAVTSQMPYFEDTPDEMIIYYPLLSVHADRAPLSVARVGMRSYNNEWLVIDDKFTRVLTQLATSIERSLEMHALEERAARFNKMYQFVVPTFSLCDNMRALMTNLGENCAQLINAQCAFIFVVDTIRDCIYTYLAGTVEQYFPLRDSDNVACHVAVTGQTVNLVDCKSQKKFRVEFLDQVVTHTCLVTPILNKRTKAVFGVLVAMNKQEMGYFSKHDQTVLEDFQEVCWVSMSIAVERHSHVTTIESIIGQRNNLLLNINDVERTKEKMANLCRLLTNVASCVDHLTVIHRFVSGAKDAFGLADVKYMSFSPESGMLMTDRGALDVNAVGEGSSETVAGGGALIRCVRSRQPVHITEVIHSNKINRHVDLPPGFALHDAAELMFVPFLLTCRGDSAKMNDVAGVFRFVSKEKGILDKYMLKTMTEISALLQYLCDRGKKLELAAQQSSTFKDIYAAHGTRSLFRAITASVKRHLRCARAYVLVADPNREVLWSLTGANYDQKVEMPLVGKNLEHNVLHLGTVVNGTQINKQTLDQSLGNSPKVILAVPIRADKATVQKKNDASKPGKKGARASDDGEQRDIIGVLYAADKTGMVQFDQVDEMNAMSLATAAAVGLKHALGSLQKNEEHRVLQYFINATLSLLNATCISQYTETLICLTQRLSACDDVTILMMNDNQDELLELCSGPVQGNVEIVTCGKCPYADDALRGEIQWPKECFLDKNNEITFVDGECEKKVFCVVPLCMNSGRILGILRLCDGRTITAVERKKLEDNFRVYSNVVAETYFAIHRITTLTTCPVTTLSPPHTAPLISDTTPRPTHSPHTSRPSSRLAPPPQAHIAATIASEGTTQPLILMTKPDGRLLRCHGSTMTVLGRGQSALRSAPCWKWMPECDVWMAVTKQIFFGSNSERGAKAMSGPTSASGSNLAAAATTGVASEQATLPYASSPIISSIHAANMYWVVQGRLCVADLYAVPFYVDKINTRGATRRSLTHGASSSGSISHCYFSFANMRFVQGTLLTPVCFGKDEEDSSILYGSAPLSPANTAAAQHAVDGGPQRKGGGSHVNPLYTTQNESRYTDVFVLGVRVTSRVVQKTTASGTEDNPDNEDESAETVNLNNDENGSAIVMKLMETIHQYNGEIYHFDRTDMFAIFRASDVHNCLAAGCAIDRGIGPLVATCGNELTIMATHAFILSNTLTNGGSGRNVAPLMISRLPTSASAAAAADKSAAMLTAATPMEQMPHKVIAPVPEDSSKNRNTNGPDEDTSRKSQSMARRLQMRQGLSVLAELPDPMAQIDIPADMHVTCLHLITRAALYPFQGFFCFAFPPQFIHDFVLIPVELVVVKDKVRFGRSLVYQERTANLCAVYGRILSLPKTLSMRIARFNLAFRAFKNEQTLLMAIDEFTNLIRLSVEDGDDSVQAMPQVPLLLKRALRLYLMEAKDWTGVWTYPTDPTITELRTLLKSFFHNDEPWLRQFFLASVDLIELLERCNEGSQASAEQ